jgi:hypothetical protein
LDRARLPATIEKTLALLAWRCRARLALRGLNRILLVLASLFLAIYLLNAAFGLSRTALRFLSSGGAVVGGAILVSALVAQWKRGPRPLALAGLIEQTYPALAEKLSTLLALAPSDAAQGHPHFVALLLRQTERQMRQLDCRPLRAHFPLRPPLLMTGALVVGLGVFPLCVPGSAVLARRLGAAWYAEPPWKIEVEPGNQALFRGTSVQVTACLHPNDVEEPFPASCLLRYRRGNAPRKTIVFHSEGAGRYSAELPDVQTDVSYAVEADGVLSEEYVLTVVEPIELVRVPVLGVAPPPYVAAAVHPSRKSEGARELACLQYSTLTAEFACARSPRSARLLLEEVAAPASTMTIPLALSGGDEAPRLDYVAGRCGTFRVALLLEAEHGLTSVRALSTWTIAPDAPPRFTMPARLEGAESAALLQGAVRIAVDDVLKLETVVEDAEGVDRLEVEFRVNEASPSVERWLPGGGQRRLDVADVLPLPLGLKDGDRLRFRLRAVDNRRLKKGALGGLPETELAPQVAYEPGPVEGSARWFEVRVDASAKPLLTRSILAAGERVKEAAERARKKLETARKQVDRLRRTTATQNFLTPAQLAEANKVRALNEEIAGDLRGAARHEMTPAALAERFQEIVQQELLPSAERLRKFSEPPRPKEERAQDLTAVDEAMGRALKKLADLQQANEMLAKDRLDPVELERLARRQADLERRLQQLLTDSAKESSEALARLRAEEAKLEAQLDALRKQSRLLREALAARQRDDEERLAREAEQLAKLERAATQEFEAAFDKMLAERLPALLARQRELARQAERLAKDGLLPSPTQLQQAGEERR